MRAKFEVVGDARRRIEATGPSGIHEHRLAARIERDIALPVFAQVWRMARHLGFDEFEQLYRFRCRAVSKEAEVNLALAIDRRHVVPRALQTWQGFGMSDNGRCRARQSQRHVE